MAIFESINGDKYKIKNKIGFKNGEIIIDGKHISKHKKILKKCICLQECKKQC